MIKSVKFIFIFISASLLLLSGACTFSNSPSKVVPDEPAPIQADEPAAPAEQEKRGGILKIAYDDTPMCLGYPGKMLTYYENQMVEPAVETLARYNETGALVPYLAESFHLDADSLTLVIYLRKDVRFHDGTICDAEAVKWNLEEFKASGRSEINDIESIEVKDPLTVVAHLSRWNSAIADAVLFTAGRMVSPTYVKTNGIEAAIAHPVGTGPFKFVRWDRNAKIVYEKNEDYRVEGRPFLDGIEIVLMSDTKSIVSAMRKGEIDVIATVDSVVSDAMEADGLLPISRPLTSGTIMYGLMPASNDPSLPFFDIRVRRAIAHAIDREAIAEKYKKLGWAYSDQWTPAGSWSYNEATVGYPYDVAKAKQLLTEAGYPDGFSCKGYVNEGNIELMEITQAYLAEVGIQMEIIPMTSEQENERTGIDGTWDGILRWAGRGEADIAPVYARTLVDGGVRSVGSVLHPREIKELIDAAMEAKTFSEKVEISKKLSRKVIDDYCLVIPYASISNQVYATEKVKDSHLGYYHISCWTPERAWKE